MVLRCVRTVAEIYTDMFFGMCDALLCCAHFDDSVRFCMWRKIMFVCRVCAVLCCAVMSWFVVLPFLCEPPPPPPEKTVRFGTLLLPHDLSPPFSRSVGSEGATRCWGANLGDRHIVKSLASRLWVAAGLRAEHRQADRTLATLSRKTGCSVKRGVWVFGVYVRCVGGQVRREVQVVPGCREVWGLGSGGVGKFKVQEVEGVAEFKGTGIQRCWVLVLVPKRAFFFIKRVEIHEGLCPFNVLCSCVSFLYLLRFLLCDVCDTCIVWDVRRLCGVM